MVCMLLFLAMDSFRVGIIGAISADDDTSATLVAIADAAAVIAFVFVVVEDGIPSSAEDDDFGLVAVEASSSPAGDVGSSGDSSDVVVVVAVFTGVDVVDGSVFVGGVISSVVEFEDTALISSTGDDSVVS